MPGVPITSAAISDVSPGQIVRLSDEKFHFNSISFWDITLLNFSVGDLEI